ncbi:MAG: hypothetical protein WDO56_12865 [Gammaproteobacteria bacterium]
MTSIRAVTALCAIASASIFSVSARAQSAPAMSCDASGIGSVRLKADQPPKILEAAPATAGKDATAVQYCLVKVLVPEAINIWVGLPMDGKWNGRLQSIGGGGFRWAPSRAPTAP